MAARLNSTLRNPPHILNWVKIRRVNGSLVQWYPMPQISASISSHTRLLPKPSQACAALEKLLNAISVVSLARSSRYPYASALGHTERTFVRIHLGMSEFNRMVNVLGGVCFSVFNALPQEKWLPTCFAAFVSFAVESTLNIHADTSRSQSRAGLRQHSFLSSYPCVAVEMSQRISRSVNLYLGPGHCLPGWCSGSKLLAFSACVAIAASSRRQRDTVDSGTPVFLEITLALFPSSIRAKTRDLLGVFHSLERDFESGGGVGSVVVGGTIGGSIRARCKQRARFHGRPTTHTHSLVHPSPGNRSRIILL